MNRILTLMALSCVSVVSADKFIQPTGGGYPGCTGPGCNSGGGSYQDQPTSAYIQQRGGLNQRQRPQGYFDQNYQFQTTSNQSYDQNQQYQQQGGYQPYSSQGAQRYYPQQGQQYYSQQENPSYRDQQANSDSNYGSQRVDSQKAVSDQEINNRVKNALSSGWFSSGYQGVTVDVNNGKVTLRGAVDTLENKNKVEDAVRKIDGVRQVSNQITVAKAGAVGYSDLELQNTQKKYPQDSAANAQDRQINAKIRDKLGNGYFTKGYEALIIRTNNGFVVISGTVDKVDDIQKINDQVKDVEGVRSVSNQVTAKIK